MKKISRLVARATALGLGLSLSFAFPAFAAYDDVSLTTDTVLSVNGITLNVSGSSAVIESIAVGGTTFTVTLQANDLSSVILPVAVKLLQLSHLPQHFVLMPRRTLPGAQVQVEAEAVEVPQPRKLRR
ncbi:MAG: hypothetical protein UV94_C0023G0008 [Parcubacteria group bacterium GW2011_GWC1_43_30]|nr:MAG: hypothetical protein UV94_C0023G0008 [Parcubacteria group bacterium GW2011_GWC1_43_30]